jgi:hypothetical protein
MFTDIQNLFLNQHGSFAKTLQFETIVIFVVVLVVVTQAFEKSYGFVIILVIFALYISNTYVNVKNNKVNDFNSMTMIKLQSLQSKVYEYIDIKLKLIRNSSENKMPQSEIQKMYNQNQLDSLYIDSNIIHFLFSVIKLSEYNPEDFYSLLKGTNSILKIKRDIDLFYESNGVYPENTSELFQAALKLRQNTINNMHNFVYTIPKTSIMYKYLDDSITRYATLVSRITDSIHTSYKNNIQTVGLNSSTKFVTYNTTKDFDPIENHESFVTKSDNKHLQFYI